MSTLQSLQSLIEKKYGLGPDALDPNANMRESGIDSLALVEFLFDVEETYGVSIPENESQLETLAGLAALLDQLLAAKAASNNPAA
jgi:acyl carrier protein